MAFEIVQSSPKAKEVAKTKNGQETYPFDQLEVGQSFTAKLDEVNWKSLRICVYQRNSRSNGVKEFAFIKHDDLGICEVACIA